MKQLDDVLPPEPVEDTESLADRQLAFELDPRNFTEAMRLRNKLVLRPRARRRLTRSIV